MKRSRDDGPGAGAAIKRCERDATRRRCDRASTRRRDARARDATTTRDAGFATRSIGAEFSCRLRRDDGRPTDDRGPRARREDDDDARGDECAMTDDARAIADGRQAGSGGRER